MSYSLNQICQGWSVVVQWRDNGWGGSWYGQGKSIVKEGCIMAPDGMEKLSF
jgi:hypothetical protein